jgi:hypothetical protein
MHYSYHYLCACPFIILTAGFSYIDANVGFPFFFFFFVRRGGVKGATSYFIGVARVWCRDK